MSIRIEHHWSGRWFVIVTFANGSESVEGCDTREEARRLKQHIEAHVGGRT